MKVAMATEQTITPKKVSMRVFLLKITYAKSLSEMLGILSASITDPPLAPQAPSPKDVSPAPKLSHSSYPSLDRVQNRLETPGHLELAEYVVQMTLDRLLADQERVGDVLVRSS